MNVNDIKSMFEGVSEDTKAIIARKLRTELANAITLVHNKMAIAKHTREQLSPQPDLIMNAFRLCPLEHVRVVLLGQDPYIKPGEAMGLSFSVPKNKRIPPSLRKIYDCLMHHGLVRDMPDHGDLTSWASQGVLLINAALTTIIGKSNAHADAWSAYTDSLIREVSQLPQQLIFILLGGFAHEKRKLIDPRRHVVIEWGHPSPLNTANQSDNPKNFKYCNAFTRVNDMLILRGDHPINWDPVSDPHSDHAHDRTILDIDKQRICTADTTRDVKVTVREASDTDPAPLTTDTLWVFTDGGSIANGKPECVASWSFYITDGCNIATAHGMVAPVDIPCEEFKSSNQRGELTAILAGLEYISGHMSDFDFERILIVSDSEYSINCISKWAATWLENPTKHKLSEKKNLDLIIPAKELRDGIHKPVDFKHIRSHKVAPADTESHEWFLWKGNDIVDINCNIALGRAIGKK